MTRGREGPPRLAEALLRAALPDDVAGRSVVGDLHEEYVRRARAGRLGARWWYRREAAGVAVRALLGRGRGRRGGDPVGTRLWTGIRQAARTLVKTPRFTVVAAVTLALGIGAVTAIFSVVDGVLLRPLPYPESERLVWVSSDAPGLGYDDFPVSPDVYDLYRDESSAFEELGAYQATEVNLTGDAEPERVSAAVATASFFDVLRVPAVLGRAYGADDDVPEASPVVVLSHALWTRRYDRDPSVLGRSLIVDGTPREIVGVMQERFDLPDEAQLWIPAGFDPDNPTIGTFGWSVVGRLAPDATVEGARIQLAGLVERLLELLGADSNYRAFLESGGYAPRVAYFKEQLVGDLAQPLWILLGTVAFVLLIACANVANLVLIRAEGRQRETAVRSALGADRGTLVAGHLAESGVLAAVGGAAGLLIAWVGVPALLRMAPPQLPRIAEVGVDLRVLAFGMLAVAVSALLFGVVPALRYTRPGVLAALRQGSRGSTGGRERRIGRGALVVAQTGLALVLLVGSGLLVRSFWRLLHADPGFTAEDVLTFRVSAPTSSYPEVADVAAFQERLIERLGALPGVEAVGAVSELPVAQTASGTAHQLESKPVEPGTLPPMIHYKAATPGFFDALRIGRLRGETLAGPLASADRPGVVVNRAFADTYFPGEEVLGQRIAITGTAPGDSVGWFPIVGVVESVRDRGLRTEVRPLVYYPMQSGGVTDPRSVTWVVRGPNAASLAPSVRAAVWEIDPDLPVARVETMERVMADSVVQLSFTMLTLAVAAGMALLLGAIGLYGVLSYAVSQRTRELGVRIALGAQRASVMRMVVGEGARLAVLGLVVGLAGAAALTRVLQGMLYGTEALDPATFAATAALLLGVAVLASWLPARRAASVDPIHSLKAE